jgi:hypothetical protein
MHRKQAAQLVAIESSEEGSVQFGKLLSGYVHASSIPERMFWS